MSDSAPDLDVPPPPRRRKVWLWILILLPILLIPITVGLGIYNSRSRLTPERLAEAQSRWDAAGVRDYDLDVKVSGRASGEYHVEVRNGRVTTATLNGQSFERLDRAYPWTVPGLFSEVLEKDLENDAKPGAPVAHTQAHFDDEDGHLIRYTRSSNMQNVQIETTLTRR